MIGTSSKMAGCGDIDIAGKNKFAEYKHNANEVVNFKLVRTEQDVFDESIAFQPDMTHQLFGESESIFGYKDLKIDIFCTAARMDTYVKIHYTDKITPEKFDGVSADDIWKVLNENLQPGYMTSQDELIRSLEKKASFKPYGELIHSYKRKDESKEGPEKEFVLYKTKIEERDFRGFHERIQPFLMFYVDAASYIDVDDERWDFYLLFEKYTTEGENTPKYAFVGYQTVYNYFAYPAHLRPRISQVLVLPPYQKLGHGAEMIQVFYNQVTSRKDVLDITVEDPSENYQRVRDFVDVRNCLRLPCFAPEKLRQGFSKTMAEEARSRLKLNRKQARRVYEILRLHATNTGDQSEFRDYRLDVKKRLNIPFQKNGRDFEKLKRALKSEELAATMNHLSREQRLEYLDREFKDLFQEYKRVLERLSWS